MLWSLHRFLPQLCDARLPSFISSLGWLESSSQWTHLSSQVNVSVSWAHLFRYCFAFVTLDYGNLSKKRQQVLLPLFYGCEGWGSEQLTILCSKWRVLQLVQFWCSCEFNVWCRGSILPDFSLLCPQCLQHWPMVSRCSRKALNEWTTRNQLHTGSTKYRV